MSAAPTIDRRVVLAVRALTTAVVFGVIVFIAIRTTVPSGRLRTQTNFLRPSPFFSILKPSERVVGPEGRWPARDSSHVALFTSPVYIDLFAPDTFDRIMLTLRYRNEADSMAEIGAYASGLDGSFVLRPIEHRLLDSLDWQRVSGSGLTLFQRQEQYPSVDAFLVNPPDSKHVAVFYADAVFPHHVDDDVSSSVQRTMDVSLRGSHRFLTYVAGEDLHVAFSVQDMNRQEGADPVTVTVTRLGDPSRILAQTVLADDGNASDDQRATGLRTISVTLTAPSSGAYRVDVSTSDDTFIRSIRTPHRAFVADGTIYLGDHVGYSDRTDPVRVFIANGHHVSARVRNPAGVQTITVNGSNIAIGEATITESLGPRQVVPHVVSVPGRDVLLASDGVFAFAEDRLFDPRPADLRYLSSLDSLNAAHIDFILTSYVPPVRDGAWLVATAEFDLAGLATTDDGAYRFLINAPGTGDYPVLMLGSLRATLRRPADTWIDAFARLLVRPDRPQPGVGADRVVPDGVRFHERIP